MSTPFNETFFAFAKIYIQMSFEIEIIETVIP